MTLHNYININISFSQNPKLAYYIHKATLSLRLLDWAWKHDILGHVVTNESSLLGTSHPGVEHKWLFFNGRISQNL